MSNFNAVQTVIRMAVNADHSDDVIEAGFKKVLDTGHSLTAETLRRAIEGDPKRDNQTPKPGSVGKQANYTDEEYRSGW